MKSVTNQVKKSSKTNRTPKIRDSEFGMKCHECLERKTIPAYEDGPCVDLQKVVLQVLQRVILQNHVLFGNTSLLESLWWIFLGVMVRRSSRD